MTWTRSRPAGTWRDLPDTSTPILAAHVENWEGGIEHAYNMLGGNFLDPREFGTVSSSGDSSVAINAMIAEAATTTGWDAMTVPAGTIRIDAPLDFTPFRGKNHGFWFVGAGAGQITGTAGLAANTLFDYRGGASCLKLYGLIPAAGSTSQLQSVHVGGFMISLANGAGIGTNWAIDLDCVQGGADLFDIFVWGANKSGNGLQFANNAHGQSSFRNIVVSNLDSNSIGFRVAQYPTANCLGTVPAGGNSVFDACSAIDTAVGWQLGPGAAVGVAGGQPTAGVTLNSPKAVRTSDLAGSIGVYLGAAAKGCVLNAPHMERFDVPYWLATSSIGCQLNAPLAAGASTQVWTAGAAGLVIDGKYHTVSALRVAYYDYAVSLTTNAAGNDVTFFGDPGHPPASDLVSSVSPAQTSNKVVSMAGGYQVLTYGPSVNTNAVLQGPFSVTATDAVAFKIENPTNLLPGQTITYRVVNNSGGALGAITWGNLFHQDGSFAAPADGKWRTITFFYTGAVLAQVGAASGDLT